MQRCPGCFSVSGNKGSVKEGLSDMCPVCGFRADGYQPPARSLPIGTLLSERYASGKVLGSGGFGITYLAFDLRLQIAVAIKEFLPRAYALRTDGDRMVIPVSDRASDAFQHLKEAFLEESRMLARFSQEPGIVSVLDFFEENGTAYLVMMHVDGVTVEEWLTLNGGRTTFEEAVALLLPVMDSLEAVHAAGIIHRDISPDNILVTHARQVRLVDFGAAREMAVEMESAALPGSVSIIFKRGYAPPEQYRNHREELGPWTDIYALAATLYRMITGLVPEDAVGRLQGMELVLPSSLGVEIDPSAEKVLMQALAVDRKERPRSMRRFRDALVGDKASLAEVVLTGRRSDLEGREPLESVPQPLPQPLPMVKDSVPPARSMHRVPLLEISRRKIAWMAGSCLFLFMLAGAYWIGKGGLANSANSDNGNVRSIAGSKLLAFTRLTDDAQAGGSVLVPSDAVDEESSHVDGEAMGSGTVNEATPSVSGSGTVNEEAVGSGTVNEEASPSASEPAVTQEVADKTEAVPAETVSEGVALKSGDLDANGIPWYTGDPVPNGKTINSAIAQHINRMDGLFNELTIVYPEQVVKRVYRIGNDQWQPYVEPLRFSCDDRNYVKTCGYDASGNFYFGGLEIRPFSPNSLEKPQTGQTYEAETYEGMTGRAANQEQVMVDNTRIHVEGGNQFEYAMDIPRSGTWSGTMAIRAVGANPETVLSFRTSLETGTVQVPIAAEIGTEWRKIYFDIPFVVGVQRLFLRCESGGSVEIDWFVFQ